MNNPPAWRSRINPAIFQQQLDSARNAGAKGQAQWHTPAAWAGALTAALPVYRPVIADFNCGVGSFLCHAAGKSTNRLLGCDIDPDTDRKGGVFPWSAAFYDARLTADVTRLYPLLHALKWSADLFVLNPPWDLHWYRDRLKLLEQSDCLAIINAFAAHDGRTSRDTIDSTIATLCLALDRLSPFGEGVMIANNATLERLMFGPNSPHAALAAHVWCRMIVPGNICEPGGGPPTGFHTGIIFFARQHTRGLMPGLAFEMPNDPAIARRACEQLQSDRATYRHGKTIKPWDGLHTTNSYELWTAAREEYHRLHAPVADDRSRFNIYLDANDGTLATNLSLYEQTTGKVTKLDAVRLHALNGRQPMQLIVQRTERKALEEAVLGRDGQPSPWRVAPAVVAAVQQALLDFNLQRAPLVPLSPIQRLGYVDELEEVQCIKDLKAAGRAYVAGRSYKLRTETLRVLRHGSKMNNEGSLDKVEYNGSELAIWIGNPGYEALVMEARFKNDRNVKLSLLDATRKRGEDPAALDHPIAFTLQQFAEHFAIPEVPAVAELNPALHQNYVDMLHQIEEIANL